LLAEASKSAGEAAPETLDPVPAVPGDVQSVSLAPRESIQILSRWLRVTPRGIGRAKSITLLVAIVVGVGRMICGFPAKHVRHGTVPHDRNPDHGKNNNHQQDKHWNQATAGARHSLCFASSHRPVPPRLRAPEKNHAPIRRTMSIPNHAITQLGVFGRSYRVKISRDFGELGEGGLQIFDDVGGDDFRSGKVGAVFEAFVFEPEPSRSGASETDCPKRGAIARLSGREEVNMSRLAVSAATFTAGASRF
jgi:hypothetical protein